MRMLLMLITIMFFTISCLSQNAFKKNICYGELAGNGIFLSVNYERQLGNKPGLGLHLGLGNATSDENFTFSIPAGVNYLFNIAHQKSFIEAGAGITWAEQNVWENKDQNPSHQFKPGFVPSIGYRHHTHYGLMYKINCNSFFTKYQNIIWYPGISIGWRI